MYRTNCETCCISIFPGGDPENIFAILVKPPAVVISPTSSLYIGKSQFNKKVVIDLIFALIAFSAFLL